MFLNVSLQQHMPLVFPIVLVMALLPFQVVSDGPGRHLRSDSLRLPPRPPASQPDPRDPSGPHMLCDGDMNAWAAARAPSAAAPGVAR